MGPQAIRQLIEVDRYYLLIKILKRKDLLHPWLYARCREVEAAPDDHIDIWAREHGKAVALDEPVSTPNGWTTHGCLKPGDRVYGADGQPTDVVAVSPIWIHSDCLRVRFDDESEVTVSGNHLWTIERRTRRRVDGTSNRRIRERVTLDTQSLANQLDPRTSINVQVAQPLQNPEASLPIDPYLLGAWLGDGHSHAARFTCSTIDFPHWQEQFCSAGHSIRVYEDRGTCLAFQIDQRNRKEVCVRGHQKTPDNLYRGGCKRCKADRQRSIHGNGEQDSFIGFAGELRTLNLYNNKHIPNIYLRASASQRLALLQGLMDTDGSCDSRGNAGFSNVNELLAKQTHELTLSLGLKSHLRLYQTQIVNGQPYANWFISFAADEAAPPFRMERKRERCRPRINSSFRYIRSIEAVESVPVSCIQVAASDGLYLVGRSLIPTHNSSLITFGGTIQEVMKDPEITVGIFSHTKPIAKSFLAQIKREFEANDTLRTLYPDILWEDPQRQSPSWSLDNGIIVRRDSNPAVATIEAHGLVDGQPTGKHFKLLVYDDVVTQESVSTPEQIQKTTESWSLSDNLGSIGGRKRICGTRYHFADTYSDIMKRGAAIPRIYPATDDGTPDGHPVLFTQEIWDRKKRDQLESTIATQMLANPLAGKQRMFNVEDLQVYEVRPNTLMGYLLIDPARSVKKDSANTAMVVLGVDAAGNKYLLDGVDHKMDLMDRWRWMRDLWQKWVQAPGVVGLQVGYERFGAIADLDYFRERQRIERVTFEIVELEWPRDGEGSKKDRVQRLVPDIKGHRFYLPYPTDDDRLTSNQQRMVAQGYDYRLAQQIRRVDENDHIYDLTERFRMEISYFPFGGNKDLVDAASRLYDIDPVTPTVVDESYLEPEWT